MLFTKKNKSIVNHQSLRSQSRTPSSILGFKFFYYNNTFVLAITQQASHDHMCTIRFIQKKTNTNSNSTQDKSNRYLIQCDE